MSFWDTIAQQNERDKDLDARQKALDELAKLLRSEADDIKEQRHGLNIDKLHLENKKLSDLLQISEAEKGLIGKESDLKLLTVYTQLATVNEQLKLQKERQQFFEESVKTIHHIEKLRMEVKYEFQILMAGVMGKIQEAYYYVKAADAQSQARNAIASNNLQVMIGEVKRIQQGIENSHSIKELRAYDDLLDELANRKDMWASKIQTLPDSTYKQSAWSAIEGLQNLVRGQREKVNRSFKDFYYMDI